MLAQATVIIRTLTLSAAWVATRCCLSLAHDLSVMILEIFVVVFKNTFEQDVSSMLIL